MMCFIVLMMLLLYLFWILMDNGRLVLMVNGEMWEMVLRFCFLLSFLFLMFRVVVMVYDVVVMVLIGLFLGEELREVRVLMDEMFYIFVKMMGVDGIWRDLRVCVKVLVVIVMIVCNVGVVIVYKGRSDGLGMLLLILYFIFIGVEELSDWNWLELSEVFGNWVYDESWWWSCWLWMLVVGCVEFGLF